jgi:hypothetical protein
MAVAGHSCGDICQAIPIVVSFPALAPHLHVIEPWDTCDDSSRFVKTTCLSTSDLNTFSMISTYRILAELSLLSGVAAWNTDGSYDSL